MSLLLAAGRPSVPFHVHPDVIVVTLLIATFFWWAFTRLGPRVAEPGETVVSYRNVRWAVIGVALVFVFSYWPIHDIAEDYLFLAHMIQHTVFTMLAPACLLMAAPPWLWRWAIAARPWSRLIRVLTKPFIALLVFNTVIAVTHFPQIVNLSVRNELFHFGIHSLLFVTATLMWIPVINHTPYLPTLRMPTRMVYLFAQSIVPTVPASFLTFSETPLYDKYERAARLIPGLNPVEDQQVAAAIMKLGAGSYLWLIIGVLFIVWWRDSQAGLADDNLRPTAASGVRIAGMAVDGRPVSPVSAAPTDEVLTWAQVEEEFARLERETDGVALGDEKA
jgi:putative membrane protein